MKLAAIVFSLALTFVAAPLFAHCDWIKGPVVADAKAAIAKGDVAPVLKWIPAAQEAEIRDAFARTMKVRVLGAEARELADRSFYETLVRIHRQSENAPYNGLRGEDYKPEPGIMLAEHALDAGSIEELEKKVSAHVLSGIRERFTHAKHAREHAEENPGAGREYVHAYAEFLHYVQGIHAAAEGGVHHEE